MHRWPSIQTHITYNISHDHWLCIEAVLSACVIYCVFILCSLNPLNWHLSQINKLILSLCRLNMFYLQPLLQAILVLWHYSHVSHIKNLQCAAFMVFYFTVHNYYCGDNDNLTIPTVSILHKQTNILIALWANRHKHLFMGTCLYFYILIVQLQ